jgi:hypothetical protein
MRQNGRQRTSEQTRVTRERAVDELQSRVRVRKSIRRLRNKIQCRNRARFARDGRASKPRSRFSNQRRHSNARGKERIRTSWGIWEEQTVHQVVVRPGAGGHRSSHLVGWCSSRSLACPREQAAGENKGERTGCGNRSRPTTDEAKSTDVARSKQRMVGSRHLSHPHRHRP